MTVQMPQDQYTILTCSRVMAPHIEHQSDVSIFQMEAVMDVILLQSMRIYHCDLEAPHT